jgi:hypothetical protein
MSSVGSDVPALVLAGDLDPRTPIENGREIVATLSRGRLITIQKRDASFRRLRFSADQGSTAPVLERGDDRHGAHYFGDAGGVKHV